MVAPTVKQICCIVGNTPLYRHFQPKLPPTVNCRNVHKLPGLPSHSKGLPFPTRQWHTQPSPNTPPGHISCSTPKEMLRMAHKTAFGGPAEQFWCAIVLEREGKSGKAQKKVATRPPSISFSRQIIGKDIPLTEINKLRLFSSFAPRQFKQA